MGASTSKPYITTTTSSRLAGSLYRTHNIPRPYRSDVCSRLPPHTGPPPASLTSSPSRVKVEKTQETRVASWPSVWLAIPGAWSALEQRPFHCLVQMTNHNCSHRRADHNAGFKTVMRDDIGIADKNVGTHNIWNGNTFARSTRATSVIKDTVLKEVTVSLSLLTPNFRTSV